MVNGWVSEVTTEGRMVRVVKLLTFEGKEGGHESGICMVSRLCQRQKNRLSHGYSLGKGMELTISLKPGKTMSD